MKFTLKILIVCLLLASMVLTSACNQASNTIDPSDWGYTCTVFYNALGGIINQREVRETYYLENSYVYKPSGSSGFLIEPEKSGCLLIGWYTDKEDILDDEGNIIGYSFKAEDRWDFSEDRVTEDMTLYARWLELETVDYINADPELGQKEIVFTKNISTDYGIIPLSVGLEASITPKGYTLYDYYADKACTTLYDFTAHSGKSLAISDRELYVQLAEEFPDCFQAIEGFVWDDENDVAATEISMPDLETDEDTSTLFIQKVGFDLITDDPTKLEQIRTRKDEIFEDHVQEFIETNVHTQIYLKFLKGNYIRVQSVDTLKRQDKYYLDCKVGATVYDGYIFMNDLDFTGITLQAPVEFSGEIYGRGCTISNLTLTFNNGKARPENPSKKKDFYGLFSELNGAVIKDLNFENITVAVSEGSGNSLAVGVLAGNAVNSTIENCTFTNVLMRTGAKSFKPLDHVQQESDTITRQAYFGDILGESTNTTITGCSYENCTYQIDGTAEIIGALFQ